MLTIITGTPGAGKSLYAVWELARKVPGSTIENDGVAVPRRLLSNVKNLLVEHQHITAQDLETWHEWAQPGDVILFDEVQEVWRPRGLGTKVPDCIAALETHRHKGVDIILITQHPMLVDPNIRRLCNQHLHLRRLARTVAYVYEWDHCANPGQVRTAIQSRVWFHPKAAYKLYKSAQLHTKATARIPRIAYLGLAAAAALVYLAPSTYARLAGSLGVKETTVAAPVTSKPLAQREDARAGLSAQRPASAPSPVLVAVPRVLGCVAMRDRCECFDDVGQRQAVDLAQCTEGVSRVGTVVPLSLGGMGARPHVNGQSPAYPTASGTGSQAAGRARESVLGEEAAPGAAVHGDHV